MRALASSIAEGDSWFDYPFHDVLSDLEDSYGFDVESVAHMGDTVEDMAYSDGQLDDFLACGGEGSSHRRRAPCDPSLRRRQ